MNSGIFPILLLSATFGLALAFVPLQAALIGLAAMAATSVVVAFLPLVRVWPEMVYVGLWSSLIATAVAVYFPLVRSVRWVIPAGLNAGLWTGAYVSISGLRAELPIGFISAVAFVPGRWCVDRGYAIVIKVVASWQIAIAMLSLFVSLLPTPGYMPDHME